MRTGSTHSETKISEFVKSHEFEVIPSCVPEPEILARVHARISKITVLTGAGISTDSGIPDFRGRNVLWTKNPDAIINAPISEVLHQICGVVNS